MLDTNILVSIIFFPSFVTKRFVKALSKYDIVICDYVIKELQIVTERKFPHKLETLNRFFYEDLKYQLVMLPEKLELEQFPRVRDEKDTPILAISIIEDVDIFVTGDKDFFALRIERPKIVTMIEFIEKY